MPGTLSAIYIALQQHFGTNPTWWPIFGDDAPFEKVVGAILVQQTRWETVEHAILRLRDAQLLAPHALAQADVAGVAALLRPVAFYTQKAAGIIALSVYLCEYYEGSVAVMLAQPTDPLRSELLRLQRVGPETADVMLLYAGDHPVFVIDDYTRRMFGRIDPYTQHNCDWHRGRYEVVQHHIEEELSHTNGENRQHLYADYHALINEHCVRYCLARNPRCDGPPARRVYSIQAGREAYLNRHEGCPLRDICAFYQTRTQ